MDAEWTPYPLSPAENFQDPIQHWLLVPSPDGKDDESYLDLILAYVFRFDSASAFEAFRQAFGPKGRSGKEEMVFFPSLQPLPVPDTKALVVVGFSRLRNLQAIFRYLASRRKAGDDGGEFFLTGVPIENFDEVQPPDQSTIRQPEAANVVAIIDTDIAFANARFRNGVATTRIAAYWDQNATARTSPDLLVGRALLQSRIDEYLEDFLQGESVDEPALYAAYYAETYAPDAYPRLPASNGHGTHVLDVIDGTDLGAGDGLGDPILAVNLRNRAVDATHGLLLLPWVLLGILWILQLCGTAIRPQINFSFGGIAGRHDGRDPLELVLDLLLGANGAPGLASAVTVPAGNFYGTRTHARLTREDLDTPQNLNWMVQPDDGTSNILEIWLPAPLPGQSGPQIEVTLTPPGGPPVTFSDADMDTFRELKAGGRIRARIYIQRADFFGASARPRITIITRHTALDRDYFQFKGGAPDLAGAWTLRVEARSLQPKARVQLWIERDDPLGLARNGARQSRFEAPRPVWPEPMPPSFVSNEGTTSDIASGGKTLIAAGSLRNTRQPAHYSSEAFVREEAGDAGKIAAHPPTAATPCDDSRVHSGVLATGFFSGSTRAMNGTSAASAMLARKVNTRIHEGGGVTRADIEALAATEDGRAIPAVAPIERPFGTYNPVPPKTRIGSGCLDLPWTRLPRIDG